MRWVVALALLGVAFAGCAESSDGGPVEESTAIDEELVATDDTGVIRGVVVDDTITPIQGASVTISGLGAETETGDDGSFGFSELDPGTYFLEVRKPGYDARQSSAEVQAGVSLPDITRIIMTKNGTLAPQYALSQFSGNLRCGVASPAASFGCSVIRGTEDLVEEYNGEERHYDILPDWLQVEMYWESTQPAGESLYVGIRHCCDNHQLGGGNAGSRGASPQTVWVNKTNMLAHADGAVANDGFELSAFPSGLEALEDNGVRFGLIIDQSFEWFVSEFYNFEPEPGWTFINDGAHPLPQ